MRTGLTLVFDADDTLWENNVVFERVIDDFTAWLAHPTLDAAAVRAVLRDVEVANAQAHGYGSRVFLRSLRDVFARLRDRPADADEQAEIDALAAALREHRMELVPEVAVVLQDLGTRHHLRLLTKGDPPEQQGKIDASGLAHHFLSTHVVAEKDVPTYAALTAELELDPASTWMIGNSPKSDVLPARAVGWGAVFIPNDHTWALEHAELDDADDGVLRLRALPDLLRHF